MEDAKEICEDINEKHDFNRKTIGIDVSLIEIVEAVKEELEDGG